MDRGITEKILDLTLEIIYLLTGEDFIVVRRSSGKELSHIPIMQPPPGPNAMKKIVEVTQKIIELLKGEVPIRCQDVTVYFSMEEWEYLEGHKDLYKDVMMEDRQAFPSPEISERAEVLQAHKAIKEDLDSLEDEGVNTKAYCMEDSIKEEDLMGGDGQICIIQMSPNATESLEPLAHIKAELDVDHLALHTIERVSIACEDHLEPTTLTNSWAEYRSTREEVESCVVMNRDDNDRKTQLAHPSRPPPQSPEKKVYTCEECQSTFTSSSEFFKHQLMYTGPHSLPCLQCGKFFGKEEQLVKHQLIHTSPKLYTCPECNKSFRLRSLLIEHLRTHTGEKPFACKDCGKCFAQRSTLMKHVRAHSGERPYSCLQCGKSFNQKSMLVNHQRTHTGERPYACLECGKRFSHSTNLVTHQRIHSGEKPYSCQDCGKCFTKKSALTCHQRTHTGERPYACSECGKNFTRSSYLLLHQRIHMSQTSADQTYTRTLEQTLHTT